MIVEPGSVIRDLRILKLIGSGGMGEVYLAEETLLGRKVAIKVLNPLLTGDEQFRQRFVNEARIQASLQHPHIVDLRSFFEQDGVFFMVLEFAEGETLKDLIARTGPIPEHRVRKMMSQILSALSHAHAKGVMHRDIKPSNIMVNHDDGVKVMDFGIARIMGDMHLTRTGLKVGTLYYMSPEQVLTPRELDQRTDIYSAGIVLYEMLSGRLPFDTDTDSDYKIQKEIVDNQLPDPRQFYPGIETHMVDLVFRMTAKEVDQRPRICDILIDLAGKTPAPLPEPEMPRKDIRVKSAPATVISDLDNSKRSVPLWPLEDQLQGLFANLDGGKSDVSAKAVPEEGGHAQQDRFVEKSDFAIYKPDHEAEYHPESKSSLGFYIAMATFLVLVLAVLIAYLG